jgi:hypothetical protein
MRSPSTFGVIIGMVIALAILGALSIMLLNSDGANYKVLVAVWLWLLPVTGFFAGIGYAAGKIVEMFTSAKNSDEAGLHADAR